MSSLAGTHAITLDQGASFSLLMVWRNKRTKEPISLVGYTARMKVKAKTTGYPLLKTLTTENGGITLGGVEGSITLTMSDEETAALKAGTHSYDLELEDASGHVTKLLRGSFVVRREVTD